MAKESKSTLLPQLIDGVSRIPLPGSKRSTNQSPPSITASSSIAKTTQIFHSSNMTGTYLTKQQRPSNLSQPSITASSNSVTPTQIIRSPNMAELYLTKQQRPSNLRPPLITASSSSVKPTQIFRSPNMAGTYLTKQQRLNAYIKEPSTSSLEVIGDGGVMKKTISGERINSAVNVISKQTTNVLKKYFSDTKNVGKKYSLQKSFSNKNNAVAVLQTTPLMRSETFVCGDGMKDVLKSRQQNRMVQSTPVPQLNRKSNESTQLAGYGGRQNFYVTSSHHDTALRETKNTTSLKKPHGSKMLDSTTTLKAYTQTTKTFDDTEKSNKIVNADQFDSNLTSPCTNATFSNPGSVDNIPLLTNVSMPSGLDNDNTLQSPVRHIQLLNVAKEFMETTPQSQNSKQVRKNTTQLLYMTPKSASTTPDCNLLIHGASDTNHCTPRPMRLLSPMLLKGAQSDLVLPIRTPDEEIHHSGIARCVMGDAMDSTMMGLKTEQFHNKHPHDHDYQILNSGVACSLQDVNNLNPKKTRFSFGLDLTDSTLDCSIELVDNSISWTAQSHSQPHEHNSLLGSNIIDSPSSQQQQQLLKRNGSFDLDESLGILTPDQMKEFMDWTATHNTNNLELQLNSTCGGRNDLNGEQYNHSNRLTIQQCRIDQTPSPEELPLDTVEVKTDIADILHQKELNQIDDGPQEHQQQLIVLEQQQQDDANSSHLQLSSQAEPVSLQTDTEISKAEQMTISNVSKISTSFITSVTSVTSLDTGYQGDGEMSRPASRGASDHLPSNEPTTRKCGGVSRQPIFKQQQQQHHLPPIRRQDPMTDSDFFTESDADDVLHRGDRRAQVIDGQLYGPTMQPTASVFISEDPQIEDSCMESSGIFTDIENRCDEDLAQIRRQDTQDVLDMSPDGDLEGDDSTETVKSNLRLRCSSTKTIAPNENELSSAAVAALGQGHNTVSYSSQTSSTIQSSFSNDRLSAATTLSNRTSYCSVDGGNVDCKSFSSLEEAFGTHRSAECAVKRTKSTTSTDCVVSDRSTIGLATALTSSSLVHSDPSPRKHASCTTPLQTSFSSLSLTSGVAQRSLNESGRSFSTSATTTTTTTPPPRVKQQISKSVKRIGSPRANANVIANNKYNKTNPKSPPLRKTQSPNKWSAVMNKIASNKSLVKTNFSDVKSKVATMRVVISPTNTTTTGVSTPGSKTPPSVGSSPSTRLRRSPSSVPRSDSASPAGATNTLKLSKTTSSISGSRYVSKPTWQPSFSSTPKDKGSKKVENADGDNPTIPSPTSPLTKRLQANPTTISNRGTSYNKDHQKKLPSDFSVMATSGSGSQKILTKTTLRAAKKRDVRNLSISPTDLGPPPKTQQTVKGQSTRIKLNGTTSNVTNKKLSSGSSTTEPPSGIKTINRLSSSSTSSRTSSYQQLHQYGSKPSTPADGNISITTNNNSRQLKSSSHHLPKGKTSTSVSEVSNVVESTEGKSTPALDETSCDTSEFIPLDNNNYSNNPKKRSTEKITVKSNSSSPKTSTNTLTKKSQNESSYKPALKKYQSDRNVGVSVRKSPMVGKLLSPTEAEDTAKSCISDMDRYIHLKRFTGENSCLDFGRLEQHLVNMEETKGTYETRLAGLGVVVQYMTEELDAFNCSAMKQKCAKTQINLNKTLELLEEAKQTVQQLENQIDRKDAYYARKEEEQITESKESIAEIQMIAKQRVSELQDQLKNKDEEHRRAMDAYHKEVTNKFMNKSEQLSTAEEQILNLQKRVQKYEENEKELHDALNLKESQCAGRLAQAAEREEELNERVNSLTKELSALRNAKESSERELSTQLDMSNDELTVARNMLKVSNVSSSNGRASGDDLQWRDEKIRLEKEADSLRCVLELKQKEISKLKKQQEELQRRVEDYSMLKGKVSALESANEMLHAETKTKIEREKEDNRKMEDLQRALNHSTAGRLRLSFDNEALQWQLKERSRQLHIVESKLQEVSGNDTSLLLNTSISPISAHNRSSFMLHDTDILANSLGDQHQNSPPESPVVKAFIEKSESVSWVYQMDDERPEIAATKVVKRAGSLRSSLERSPTQKRQLSVSSSATSSSNLPSTSHIQNIAPNPLTQSMSASVILQHSNDTMQEHSLTRARSQSVVGKTKESKKKNVQVQRQNSSNACLSVPQWRDSLPSNSTPKDGTRLRSSTTKRTNITETNELFCKSKNSTHLITCDTSSLNTGERLSMNAFPKAMEKFQQIQESAGEAMVSSTNSEDESCSVSSEDIGSTASSSSSVAAAKHPPTTTLHKQENMSIEEVLLLERANSLSGTPMDVSWSEDADGYANDSA